MTFMTNQQSLRVKKDIDIARGIMCVDGKRHQGLCKLRSLVELLKVKIIANPMARLHQSKSQQSIRM